MRKILIATQNRGKFQEIESLLSDVAIELLSPGDINLKIKVLEDGHTYRENAIKKAKGYSEAANLLTLADDSGLEVDVLDGQPGIHSARFSSKSNATDEDRRLVLLEALGCYPQPWKARFVCVVALIDPENGIYFSEGYCSGQIIPEERGDQGFGYDPIFLVSGTEHTMAELEMDEKNVISHRARAIAAIKPRLIQILGQ